MTLRSAGNREDLAHRFHFWTPDPGDGLRVGPERMVVELPLIPLPVRKSDWKGERPTDDAIGSGIFDFLKLAPDHPGARRLAELLRDAFPHYLAEIGSQVLMLDAKEVDAPYVGRKINGLKILLLLSPENPDLLYQLGKSYFELGLTFTELPECRKHLLRGSGYLGRSAALAEEAISANNLLGRIDFLLGDYPAAERRWTAARDASPDAETRSAFAAQIVRLREGRVPERPLIEELEDIGRALELIAGKRYLDAGRILEAIEETGTVMDEFGNPEFPFLLGLCREHAGDLAGALEAFEKALALDPDNEAALLGRERILEGRS